MKFKDGKGEKKSSPRICQEVKTQGLKRNGD